MHASPATAEGRRLLKELPFAVSTAASWRVGLFLCALLAVTTAYAAGDPTPLLRADPGLARLLRGMAILKASVAVPVLALVYRRFGLPVSPRIAIGYIVGVSVMAAGAALIWQLSFLGPTALFFHAALICLLLIARQDDCRPAWLSSSRAKSKSRSSALDLPGRFG